MASEGRVTAETVYNAIKEHPGIDYAGLARLLNVKRCALYGKLAALEPAGMLVSEDAYGRLFIFKTSGDQCLCSSFARSS